jgi:exoribonuclease-2
MDDISLEVGGTVVELLDAPQASSEESDEDDDASLATPVALAIDLNEAPANAEGADAS